MKGGQKKSDLKRSRWFPVCLITQVQLQLRYLSTCRLMGSLTGWMLTNRLASISSLAERLSTLLASVLWHND